MQYQNSAPNPQYWASLYFLGWHLILSRFFHFLTDYKIIKEKKEEQ